jgi:hypothetical protein
MHMVLLLDGPAVTQHKHITFPLGNWPLIRSMLCRTHPERTAPSDFAANRDLHYDLSDIGLGKADSQSAHKAISATQLRASKRRFLNRRRVRG